MTAGDHVVGDIDEVKAPVSMLVWLFRSIDFKRFGVYGALAGILINNLLKSATPLPETQMIVSALVSVAIGVATYENAKDYRRSTTAMGYALCGAFCVVFLLYFLSWTGVAPVHHGYDAVTDALGSVLFIWAWSRIPTRTTDMEERRSSALSYVATAVLVCVAASMKFTADVRGADIDSHAARELLNFANGAIVFGIYVRMRQNLPRPDAVSNLAIMLFSCSQVAAASRDCLAPGVAAACVEPSSSRVLALVVAWSLLVGKLALGAYATYVCVYDHKSVQVAGDAR